MTGVEGTGILILIAGIERYKGVYTPTVEQSRDKNVTFSFEIFLQLAVMKDRRHKWELYFAI